MCKAHFDLANIATCGKRIRICRMFLPLEERCERESVCRMPQQERRQVAKAFAACSKIVKKEEERYGKRKYV